MVKKEERKRDDIFSINLRTDELNTKFGGGIPKSSIILIEAPNTLGKSVMAQRIFYGFIKNGYTGTYVSTELNVVGFLNQFNSLGYNIREEYLKQQAKFFSIFPMVGKVNMRKNFMFDVVTSPNIFSTDIVVFDTISKLLIEDEISIDQCYYIFNILKRITGLGKSVVLTVDPHELSETMLKMIRSQCTVYFTINVVEQFGSSQTIFKTERFNGAAGEVEKTIAIKVRANLGVVVEVASLS